MLTHPPQTLGKQTNSFEMRAKINPNWKSLPAIVSAMDFNRPSVVTQREVGQGDGKKYQRVSQYGRYSPTFETGRKMANLHLERK